MPPKSIILPIRIKSLLLHTMWLGFFAYLCSYIRIKSLEDVFAIAIVLFFVGWIFYFWIEYYIQLWKRTLDKPYLAFEESGLLLHQYGDISHHFFHWQDILAIYTQNDFQRKIKSLHIIFRYQDKPFECVIQTGTFHLPHRKLTQRQSEQFLQKSYAVIYEMCFRQPENPILLSTKKSKSYLHKWYFFDFFNTLFTALACFGVLWLIGALLYPMFSNMMILWSWHDFWQNTMTHLLLLLPFLLWISVTIWTCWVLWRKITNPHYVAMNQDGIYWGNKHREWNVAWAQVKQIQVRDIPKSGRLLDNKYLQLDILPHSDAKILVRCLLSDTSWWQKGKLYDIVAQSPQSIRDNKHYDGYLKHELEQSSIHLSDAYSFFSIRKT